MKRVQPSIIIWGLALIAYFVLNAFFPVAAHRVPGLFWWFVFSLGVLAG